MTAVQLPEVPAPSAWAITDYQPEANTQFTMRVDAAEHYASVGLQVEPLYTAAQLREYATEAVMLNLEMARPFIERVIARSAHAVAGISLPDSMAADWVLEHRKNVETGRALLAAFTPSETNSER